MESTTISLHAEEGTRTFTFTPGLTGTQHVYLIELAERASARIDESLEEEVCGWATAHGLDVVVD